MWPLVNEESDRVAIDGDFEDEIRWSARLHRLTKYAIVMAVDQCLVEVKD